MSRFRRQSQVKPIVAEVLELRCLLTDATGTLASDTAPADAAAPLTGDVVIGPDLWDDAGLTLQQIGDLLHVFRTDTQTDVITPLLASQITSLNIIGRDNATDVLTLDVSFRWSLPAASLIFVAGSGPNSDCLRFIHRLSHEFWVRERISYAPRSLYSGTITGEGQLRGAENSYSFGLNYNDVETMETWQLSTAPDLENLTFELRGVRDVVSMMYESFDSGGAIGWVTGWHDLTVIGTRIYFLPYPFPAINSVPVQTPSEALIDSTSQNTFLQIDQRIATDGQDEWQSAGLDTAGSDAESRPLADSTPDDDPGSDVFGFTDDELASDTDANSANLSDEFSFGLDAALSNELLESLGQPPLSS